MRHIRIKLIAILIITILSIGCVVLTLSSCGSNKKPGQDIHTDETSAVLNDDADTASPDTTEESDSVETETQTESTEVITTNEKTTNQEPLQTVPCSHPATVVRDQVNGTCTSLGYTGDTYCTSCNTLIAYGEATSTTAHSPEIRNKQHATTTSDGYTGDTYCVTCGIKLSSGTIIPKMEDEALNGHVQYILPSGESLWLDEGVNITYYTIAQSTKWINSPYRDVELEVLRICNEERANAGLAPLEWYEDTYYFANIRAKEIYKSFGHLRPDSRYWHTVYTDANVILHGAYGENIMRFKGYAVNYDTARKAVKTWMASSEHKANILNPKYTKLAVSFEWGEDNTTLCCVQSFFE